MKRNLFFLALSFILGILPFHFSSFSQTLFYSDVLNGGATGVGFGLNHTGVAVNGAVEIPSGSSITRAYLIAATDSTPPPITVLLNDYDYTFNESHIVTGGFVSLIVNSSVVKSNSSIRIIDITEDIDSSETIYTLIIPPQPLPVSAYMYYSHFYLYVLFENPIYPPTTNVIFLNDLDVAPVTEYHLPLISPVNNNHPVGMGLLVSHFCDTVIDGSFVSVNSNHLGLIGGSEHNAPWACTGSYANYSYYNNTLFGWGDDTPDSLMGGSDALADISSYLTQGISSLDVKFQYQSIYYPFTNPIRSVFLAYTTPCQPFETTVTDKVENHCGDTVQLEATGGIAYEWLPQQNLSCYDCPNPIYEGDSSTFYTVRIWNTDSCSKVLPVKINIYEPMQSVNLTTTPATCGENDGALAIGAVTGGQGAYQYRFDEDWITNPTWIGFSQLAAGDYTLSVKDQNNCLLHQPFTIGETNPAEAAFTASPSSGYAPLEVDFINQSNGINNYQWSLADSAIYSFDFSHTFDSAGSYPVQLVSWYNLPHCADTAATTVVVHPQPPDYNHTLTFPTDYNPQHGPYWVETTNIERMEWQVYNAVGQHIFGNTIETPNGSTALWDGGGHARGYYFFRVRYWDVEGKEYSGRGKVLLIR